MRRSVAVRRVGEALALVTGLVWGLPAEGRGAIPQEVALPSAVQRGDTVDLMLDRAIAIAERNDPANRRALNQLDVGGVQARSAWMGQVLPSMSLSLMNTDYDGNLQRQTRDIFGNPAENPFSEWVYSSSTSQSLSLNWSIQGRSIVNALDRLEVDEGRRELEVEAAVSNVGLSVRRQYFAILRQQELLDLEMDLLEGRRRDREAAEQRFRFAQNTRIDVLNAELAVEEQNRLIRQQRRALDQARLTLRTTLADPDLQPFRVVREALPLFDPAGLDDGTLVERAQAAHPDVRQAQVDLEAARLSLSETRATRWPVLGVSYRVGRSTFTRGGGGALFDFSHDPDDLSNNFRISLSVPYLNDFFGNRESEVVADVALRNQRESMRETRLRVEQEVRAQLIALRNQYEALVANRRRLAIAEEALDLARQQYRLGTLSFGELQDQTEAERSARRDAITAGYDFHDVLLDLETAVGGLVRGDPAAADRTGDGPAGALDFGAPLDAPVDGPPPDAPR